jgi:tRNA(fMet)-specific endonuclease VapC
MLDTNTVSHLLKAHAMVAQRLAAVPMAVLCMSAITEAELRFGLAKRPDNRTLHQAVQQLLLRVDVLPWDSRMAQRYGPLRAEMQAQGKVLAPMDLLIAAHALGTHAVLITNDQAFKHVPGLLLEDWTVVAPTYSDPDVLES